MVALEKHEAVSGLVFASQIERASEADEIRRRIQEVRSQWSVAERLERRRKARRRFAHLIDAIERPVHAA